MLSAKKFALSGLFLLAGAGYAAAADLYEPVAPVPPVAEPSLFDIAFGVTATTNYVARGISQTNAGTNDQFAPAIQPFIEATYGMVYAGIWASNVDFGAPNFGEWEVDFSAGIRPVIGPVSFDFGYVYYLYTKGPDADDLYAQATVALNDQFSIGAQVWADPGPWTVYAEGNAAFTIPAGTLPVATTLSGAVGYQTGADYWTWNAGVSFAFDPFTLDLRYHDTDFGQAYFVASLTFQTTWNTLRRGTGI